jgi:hypothetical protein
MRATAAPGLAFFLIGAAPALAQVPRLEVSLAGGVAMPVSGNPGPVGAAGGNGFKDAWAQGLSVGGALGLELLGRFGLFLNVDYSKFPLDEDNYLGSGGGTVTGGDMSVIAFGAAARIKLSTILPVAPYITLGLQGLKLSDVEVSSTSGSGSTQINLTRSGLAQDLAVVAGGGVSIRAGASMRLFVDVRAAIGTYSQASYVPVRAGLTFRM